MGILTTTMRVENSRDCRIVCTFVDPKRRERIGNEVRNGYFAH